jgi:hypothetical protein
MYSQHLTFSILLLDCDVDSDCLGGLTCWQRDGDEEVPGCIGDGQTGFDYCSNGPDFEVLELSTGRTIQTGQSQDDGDEDGDELPPARGYKELTASDNPFAQFFNGNGSGP